MSFLAPWAAWFLAGIPVIVVLYFLKLKRRPMSVSTLMFWQRVMQESRRRALFQRLRNLFSLFLHLLIFVLIVGALAKPAFDRVVRAGSSTVVILDARARMQAVDEGGESRFEKGRRAAGGIIRQVSAARQLALIWAHASPQVIVPFTGDEKPLRKALDGVTATDAHGDLAAAIKLATELLRARNGDRRIIVITDRPASALAALDGAPRDINEDENPLRHGAPSAAEPDIAMEFVPVATRRNNIAITRFATRNLLTSPETSEVLLEVSNFSDAPVRGNVELSFDGTLLDVRPFALAAGERKVDIFPSVPRPRQAARGWLVARWDGTDAMSGDNVAYASLSPPSASRVLLVTKGNWFLEKLLAADQSVNFELLAPEAFQTAMAAQFDAVILDSFVPPAFQLNDAPGNILFIKESPFASGGALIEQPLITDSDSEHPVMRLVTLQNVTIVRAHQLVLPAPTGGWVFNAPLRSFDHPLLLLGRRHLAGGEQRVAVLAFDVAESDLPLRVAFPLLMTNTIQWLSRKTPSPGLALAAGRSLILGPEQAVSAQPQTDEKTTARAEKDELVRDFFVPLRNGFYRIEDPAGGSWVPVNTFSEAESDLRIDGTSFPATRHSTPRLAFATVSGWPPWHILALAALALIVLEWWLFHRRRTE